MNVQSNDVTRTRMRLLSRDAARSCFDEAWVRAPDDTWVWRNVYVADSDEEARRKAEPAFDATAIRYDSQSHRGIWTHATLTTRADQTSTEPRGGTSRMISITRSPTSSSVKSAYSPRYAATAGSSSLLGEANRLYATSKRPIGGASPLHFVEVVPGSDASAASPTSHLDLQRRIDRRPRGRYCCMPPTTDTRKAASK